MHIGFKLMAENFGPVELVRQAERAEAVGFDFVEISDHYHPWLDNQGHSPFAWSVLAAIAVRTERIRMGTGVTCPTMRYHPAIIAQASATVAILSGGRHFLGIGAGERLNEHVIGMAWPSVATRHKMLHEALRIIRMLWSGGYHSFEGQYLRLEDARVFDLPDAPPPIIVASGGKGAARTAAEYADGIFATEPRPELIEAYAEAGGKGPKFTEVAVAPGADRAAALKVAREKIRFTMGSWPVMAELPDVRNFEAASARVTMDEVEAMVSAGPDPHEHLENVRTYAGAGFDHLTLMYAGDDVDTFFDYYANELDGPLRAMG